MSNLSLASIIINNYNYARFLREAINSALNQTYPGTEVIVVDDGSTDDSREIIFSYGDRIIPLLKENGGQNSALNAGFSLSRGEVIVFLDSDDALLPTATEAAVAAFDDPDVVKVHWSWVEWDESSRETGGVWGKRLPEGEMRDLVLREGPDGVAPYLPSGNAYQRRFLEHVFPLPDVRRNGNGSPPDCEPQWIARPGPDLYLATLAALYGRIKELPESQACYRMHGRNGYQSLKFEDRVRFDLALVDYASNAVEEHCAKLGIRVDREQWQALSWARRVQQSAQDIVKLVPPGASFVLVDEGKWKTDPFLAGRKRIQFLAYEGQYWGNPPDDAAAIRELERLRGAGADFIVFAWSAFWWFDYYSGLHRYLRSNFPCVLENDRIAAFELQKESVPL
ncbi:MAG TPA: glycosyltransferase family A protein [Bryobacteraceae bacterium]|nr:glycosyltransferase family A protein [Bryobacteraceae bacterium]